MIRKYLFAKNTLQPKSTPEVINNIHSDKISRHIERRLPSRLITELNRLAENYQDKGIRLFIFGSFTRGADRRTSDLDIGVLWTENRQPRTFTELYRNVQELPTIRKIDLVDMELVDPMFKTEALKRALFLPEKEKFKWTEPTG